MQDVRQVGGQVIRGEMDPARPESGPVQEGVAIPIVALDTPPPLLGSIERRTDDPGLFEEGHYVAPWQLKAPSETCHRSNALGETSGGWVATNGYLEMAL